MKMNSYKNRFLLIKKSALVPNCFSVHQLRNSTCSVVLNEVLPKSYAGIQTSINFCASKRFCSHMASESESTLSVRDSIIDSTPTSVLERFLDEVKTKSELTRKLEKVKVRHRGHDKNMTVEVNRNFSTPLDVARHLGRNYVKLSAVALVNGSQYLDMNEAICFKEQEIEMEFVWFKNQKHKDPSPANQTLWNTMSLMSGSILAEVLKDDIEVYPLFPCVSLSFSQGAFGYEFELRHSEKTNGKLEWTASQSELNIVNRKLRAMIYSNPSIYGTDASAKTAELIFGENSSKNRVVEEILSQHGKMGINKVRLYCCGPIVDIHPGPLLTSVGLIGQAEITSIYTLGVEGPNGGVIHRIEGVALPSVLPAHHWPWTVLTRAAREDASARKESAKSTDMKTFADWYREQLAWKKGQKTNEVSVKPHLN